MSPSAELVTSIRESYRLMREYEAIVQTASDPQERARSRKGIAEQQALLTNALDQYVRLCQQTGQAVDPELRDIAAIVGHDIPSTRVFISYKRHADPDQSLALHLYHTLASVGHRVFIDQTMQVGVAWATEIEHQITVCDMLVVLLSEASVHSEMVAKEVEFAHKQHQQTGKARLLPIRVAYPDALPYQLRPYLEHLHYAEWYGDNDTERVTRQIMSAVMGTDLPPPAAPRPPQPDADDISTTPRPYADPAFLTSLIEPGGAVRMQSAFYIERESDDLLTRELSKPYGTTTTIRAPRQTGKSSLLIRGIAHARQQDREVVFIDVQQVQDDDLESLEVFLKYLACVMVEELDLDPDLVEQAWRGGQGASRKLTSLIEKRILPRLDSRLVLALDEADRLLRVPFHDNFFGLVRSWCNKRAINNLWDRLDILMVISTEPHLLISDVQQSPFNVGLKIRLEDFDDAQVRELNHRYRSPLDEARIPALMEFLGGHPYLTRRALYTLVTHGLTWDALVQQATTPDSAFGDHLRRYLWMLRDEPDLRDALKRIIRHGTCPDEVSFYRLLQAGLIRGHDRTSCTCRCGLYAAYLKERL